MVYRAQEQAPDEEFAQRRHLDWTGLAARQELISVPGDHYSLLRPPHVSILARMRPEIRLWERAG
jgi:thioesterase domain-containing protein